MTISLDEKDKRIFELETEIDSVKVELNQVRVEAARVPELEATIHAYESRGCEEDSSLPPLPIEDLTIQDRMKGLEQRVDELVQLVEYLKADKGQLEAERDRLLQTEAEPRVEDPEISELRKRISELEEAIEISEMNRKLLRENFTKENEEKLSLIVELERLRAYVPTVETPGGALVTVEDASKLMKVQQVQIETLTLEVNTLRILPSKNVDSGETTTPDDEFVRPRPSPTGCGVGGCFGWSSRRSRA
ncbi:hypothetical protein C9890_0147 [Perkinsus sp. BL_2016]|nr:hypothetical protein C9890_0147 [Perkinsus sp. BL_2016]